MSNGAIGVPVLVRRNLPPTNIIFPTFHPCENGTGMLQYQCPFGMIRIFSIRKYLPYALNSRLHRYHTPHTQPFPPTLPHPL